MEQLHVMPGSSENIQPPFGRMFNPSGSGSTSSIPTLNSDNSPTNLSTRSSLYQSSHHPGKRKQSRSADDEDMNEYEDPYNDDHERSQEEHDIAEKPDFFSKCLSTLSSQFMTASPSSLESTYVFALESPHLTDWRRGVSRVALSEIQRELLGNRMYQRLEAIVSSRPQGESDHVSWSTESQSNLWDLDGGGLDQQKRMRPFDGTDIMEISRFVHAIEDCEDLQRMFFSNGPNSATVPNSTMAVEPVKAKVFHRVVVEMVLEFLGTDTDNARQIRQLLN
jgi:hypothetical protein